jgi:hypothetical protein
MEGKLAEENILEVTMLLCDSAQVSGGKLYILGGGWNMCGPGLPSMAIAVVIKVPWDMTNRSFKWKLQLFNEDGDPVKIGGQGKEIIFGGNFEVGRPPGSKRGQLINVPLAMNAAGIPLEESKGYYWTFDIDGIEHERASFMTRGKAPK